MIFKRQPLNCQHLTWDYYKEDVAGFNTYASVKPSPLHIVLKRQNERTNGIIRNG